MSNKLKLTGFEVFTTGGGCMALMREWPVTKRRVWIDDRNNGIPTEDCQMFGVGEFDDEGNELHFEEVVNLRDSVILNQYGVVNGAPVGRIKCTTYNSKSNESKFDYYDSVDEICLDRLIQLGLKITLEEV